MAVRFLSLVSLVPVPHNSIPTVRRTETVFRNGFGVNSRGLSQVTGVLFSIEKEGTLALCELNFSTDLVQIDSASVSCQLLYDNIGDSIVLGLLTDYDWNFFAKIGEEVLKLKPP
eukprot:TRINITY_DN6313_c0_g1_i1.p1 TRINITY_DN6313_c0_g1~~TRINITY_DN6313_c0_g1_i1.p1  ORF type:complete len:115 (-),score=16.87 TRINITY_DN6313_c0_g1_i1:58-402(-)